MTGGAGHIAAMIKSLKANDRRKTRTRFDRNNIVENKRGNALQSKEMSDEERARLYKQIRENKALESKLFKKKIAVSVIVTMVFIGVIIFLSKALFF